MAAYFVIVAVTHDRPAVLEYARQTAELVDRMGGKVVMRARGARLIEGDFGEDAGVLLMEWPDKEQAMSFWDSDEYTALKQQRMGKADVQVLLVEAELAHDSVAVADAQLSDA